HIVQRHLSEIEESYRRMMNPACQEVDANPSKEEVLKTVLQLIKKHLQNNTFIDPT
uniref:Uncharacterized protein n=1 Tax=Anas platyrhynchos platyrhynchos TaxID=8840 RepID=A0A493TX74_ANAPP